MPALDEAARQSVHELLRRHFGYDSLRPLQAEAIAAGLARQDSLVVLPTGGGKSICYQMPPLIAQRLDVVVSPLIALMKDQVDGLVANGYPAAALHSGMSEDDRAAVRHGLQEGRYRLLFVSPERLSNDAFVAGLRRYGVSSFAIDEAHCISQWGHDFRPEYRQLARLRELFPGASLHAFTATATPRVREDSREQLALREPVELGECLLPLPALAENENEAAQREDPRAPRSPKDSGSCLSEAKARASRAVPGHRALR